MLAFFKYPPMSLGVENEFWSGLWGCVQLCYFAV